ncbi:helix-turn-helix transcriptional regulator [Klebsiella sp. I138]|uniref:helix-turn-helix transcriptional regulator n=1 Tax=Klebsiella sp. I138 TaxID=2755385 RepID=UPI003DA9C294
MDSILLYTDDNFIGQSIHRYLVDNNKNITTLCYQDISQGAMPPMTGIVIFNVIHKDFSAADTMSLLNNMRWCLLHCSRLILMVKSDIASLFRELIDLDNIMILTEKSSLTDFSHAVSTPAGSSSSIPLQKKLSARERQVLELTIACHNNKKIATLLNIDHKTVHSHRIHIMQKLGMNSSRAMNKKIVDMYRC